MVWGNVTTRVATVDDVEAILPVLRMARADSPLGAQMCSPDSDRLAEQLAGWFALPRTVLLVAEAEGTVVGMCLAQAFDITLFSDVAFLQIEALFVVPNYRRRGVGRALLAQLAQFAVDREVGRIVTTVLTGARSEQRFLSGLGFGPAGSRRIVDTATLLRRLEDHVSPRERRGRGIDDLIARRRRSRGLPPTPPNGIALGTRRPERTSSAG